MIAQKEDAIDKISDLVKSTNSVDVELAKAAKQQRSVDRSIEKREEEKMEID